MEGFVKLHRKILDNPIVCKDAEYFAVWIYLLLNATHKEIDMIFKGKRTTLQPGQLITGRKSIAKQLSISESKVYRIIKDLKIEQQIEQQSSNKNSLITILNWNKYQINEQQNKQQVNNNRTTTEHKQECKNININLYIKKYMKKQPENLREKMQLIRTIKQNENLNPAEETELENYILMSL